MSRKNMKPVKNKLPSLPKTAKEYFGKGSSVKGVYGVGAKSYMDKLAKHFDETTEGSYKSKSKAKKGSVYVNGKLKSVTYYELEMKPVKDAFLTIEAQRKKLKVRDKIVTGKFRTRSSAETNKKLAEKTRDKVNGTSTYKITKNGPKSTPYVLTITRYTQRRFR